MAAVDNIPNLKLFHLPHGAGALGVLAAVKEPPEKITLADGAHVLPIPGDDGDGRVSVVPHFF